MNANLVGRVVAAVVVAMSAVLTLGSCTSNDSRALGQDGRLRVRVVLPVGAGVGLRAAAADLVESMATIAGMTVPPDAVTTERASAPVVRAELSDDPTLGAQGYALRSVPEGIVVTAASSQGLAYGLWSLAQDLGTRWIHPEQTFHPFDPDARLPEGYDGSAQTPRFPRRGFHEHTQHPIVASDFFLRPGDEERRAMASRYVRWLARNRQTVMSFHMLRTVDLDAWLPYIRSITDEAADLYIETGVVVGFVDEQQNAFKCFRPESDPRPASEQIAERIDRILEGGFEFLTFQIGASEFTKPADADLLAWMDDALTHVRESHPGVRLGAWIHTTCDLESDTGGYFFHLPLQADPAWRAWVHTTMFYTLSSPAPVYECESFEHHFELIEAARPTPRELEYFPETAWWLGFDNNVPLELPIYGWSRDRDIRENLDARTTGHVTFSSGREWGYWRYDHFLASATWEGDLTWEAYLADLAPLFGSEGASMSAAIEAFGALQVRHFYDEDPLLYFYVAGELPQDEIGVVAGLAARRPKRSFREVLEMPETEHAAWQASDLERLREMRDAYAAVLERVPERSEGTELQTALYDEARDGMRLFVRRLEHAIRLYEGVVALRTWTAARDAGDVAGMDGARAAAEQALGDARTISAEAIATVRAGELRYRYPVELLARPKPESLTIYPFGEISEASTGVFWTRRDDQLASLLVSTFDTSDESWAEPPPETVYYVAPRSTVVEVPENALAATALRAFLPGLVFGVPSTPTEGPLEIRVAQDRNGNQRPDPGFERPFAGVLDASTWTSSPADLSLGVYDDTGELLTMLVVRDAVFEIDTARAPSGVVTLSGGRLAGAIDSAVIVETIGTVTGTDRMASEELVKQVYDVEPDSPLPERLPLELRLMLRLGE